MGRATRPPADLFNRSAGSLAKMMCCMERLNASSPLQHRLCCEIILFSQHESCCSSCFVAIFSFLPEFVLQFLQLRSCCRKISATEILLQNINRHSPLQHRVCFRNIALVAEACSTKDGMLALNWTRVTQGRWRTRPLRSAG
jgi:hypothetical protein